MSLWVKFKVESGGVVFSNTGGSVSFGPPVGATICAQRGNNILKKKADSMRTTKTGHFVVCLSGFSAHPGIFLQKFMQT